VRGVGYVQMGVSFVLVEWWLFTEQQATVVLLLYKIGEVFRPKSDNAYILLCDPDQQAQQHANGDTQHVRNEGPHTNTSTSNRHQQTDKKEASKESRFGA